MSYWDNICSLQARQTAKGLATYGQVLEENKSLTRAELHTMIEEELIDALMYLEAEKVADMENDKKAWDAAFKEGYEKGKIEMLKELKGDGQSS